MGETEQVEEKQDIENKMTTGKEKISRTEYNRNRRGIQRETKNVVNRKT